MKPLPDGGTIGVAACASPYDMRSELDRGVEWWESQGYRVKLGPGVHDRDDYVAGDAKRRADDLHALFADPEVDVVQSLQGGLRVERDAPPPRLRPARREPKAVHRLQRHHVAARPDPAARRLPDLLRLRPGRRRRQGDDRVQPRAPAAGAARRRRRRGAARPRRPVRPRDRAAARRADRSSAAASGS